MCIYFFVPFWRFYCVNSKKKPITKKNGDNYRNKKTARKINIISNDGTYNSLIVVEIDSIDCAHSSTINSLSILFLHLWRVLFVPIHNIIIKQNYYMILMIISILPETLQTDNVLLHTYRWRNIAN